MDSTNEMMLMGNYYRLNGATDMMISKNSSIMNSNLGINPAAGNSSASLFLDSVPGLKHDADLAVEWSVKEQYKLEEELVKALHTEKNGRDNE
ncbi:hypothetical protein LguiB_015607 [Lonicera macranthoides]